MAGRVARIVNLVLSVWLFVSAFLWRHTTAQRTNAWVLGVVGAIVALVALSRSRARWINTALAIWLFISPFALPTASAGTTWNCFLVGGAIFVLTLVGGGDSRPIPAPRRATA